MMCDNYRAVTLLRTTYKILKNILYIKLLPYAEKIIGECQGGLRREIPTVDQLFTVSQIMGKFWGTENRCTSGVY